MDESEGVPPRPAPAAAVPATAVASAVDTRCIVGPTPTIPKKNNLLTSTLTVGKDFELALELRPRGALAGWTSIIHFTANNENHSSEGSRVPALCFNKNKTSLHVVCGSEDNANAHINTAELPIDEWSTVRLLASSADGPVCQVFVNEQLVGNIPSPTRRPFDNVNVYLGDPWHNAAACEIRNCVYRVISLA